MGPGITYSSDHSCDGGQRHGDALKSVTSPLRNANNELKRKINPDIAAEVDEELNARKKFKVSVVPAVNLYE